MARGWESKSIEDQQSLHDREVNSVTGSHAENTSVSAARTRRRRDLELIRERILAEKTANPIRRAALQTALVEIETQLAEEK